MKLVLGHIKTLFVLLIITITVISCQKSNTASSKSNYTVDTSLSFLSYQIKGQNPMVTIQYPSILVQFADSVQMPGNLVASFTLPAGDVASVSGTRQTSGISFNDFSYSIFYVVKNQLNDSSIWQVTGTNNNYTLPWGLGQWLQQSRSNNRDYDWYIDQSTTGTCSLTNCGPSCATMAMKWSDSTFNKNASDARAYFNDNCDDWNNSFVSIYLNTDSIPYSFIPTGDSASQMRDIFKAQLDSGRIIIISLSMGSIPFSNSGPDSRVDQFCTGAAAHYIILKGYRQTETDFFFEVYDPWNLGLTYSDGTPKGENRFYRYENLFIGMISNGGGTQIAISKKN